MDPKPMDACERSRIVSRHMSQDPFGGVLRSYCPPSLSSAPKLGDRVHLLTGGPELIVVSVSCVDCQDPPFQSPIGVIYTDSAHQLHRMVVPFGALGR
jgi:hypothetical protein